MRDPLFLIGTILVLLAAIPANGIVWTYRHVPWRKSRLGRIMFTKSAAIAAVLDLSLAGAIMLYLDMGRPWWWEAIRLSTFTAVTIALWAQWAEYRSILHEAQERDTVEDDTTGHTFS